MIEGTNASRLTGSAAVAPMASTGASMGVAVPEAPPAEEEVHIPDPESDEQPPSRATMAERLTDALEALSVDLDGVDAAAIVTTEGLCLASLLGQEAEERIGGVTASLLATAENAMADLGAETADEVLITGPEGRLIVSCVSDDAVLVAHVDMSVKLGILLLAIRKASDVIQEVL